MQARQQVFGNVLVPQRIDARRVVALRFPFLHQRPMDRVDDLDEEGAGPGGRIENPHEVLLRRDAFGNFQVEVLVARGDLRPRAGVG